MLDALYGEPGTGAFDAHQQQCAECREELRALRRLRRDLGAWTVPAGPGLLRAARSPWLGRLAAAILVGTLAGLWLAGTDVRVGDGAVTVRIGRPAPDPLAHAALADVHRLIRESEARQAVLFDAGLRTLAERSEAQRRDDMAQMTAGLSYLEGRTGLQVARTTELMGHVLQASQRR
jgi:hypothetical protein